MMAESIRFTLCGECIGFDSNGTCWANPIGTVPTIRIGRIEMDLISPVKLWNCYRQEGNKFVSGTTWKTLTNSIRIEAEWIRNTGMRVGT